MRGLQVDVGVAMTTRDGVLLVGDVYRPDGDAPHPALLHRTPYDRTDPTLVSAIVADPVRLARQGYAVVVQDVRGRFGSGGEMDFFHQEQADGYDAVEWAAAQPWCDGRVGIYGSSYHAMAAFQAVAARPPHLRAAVAMIGATDLAATARPGGLFELGFLALYGLGHAVEEVRRLDLPDAEKAALLGRIGAAFAGPRATVATLPVDAVDVLAGLPHWRDWVHGPHAAAPTLRERPDLVGVPLLQVIAYRDFMAPTMVELFRALDGPASEDLGHRLIAGPWAHGGTYTGHVGSRVYPGATGGVGTWGPVIAGWFDRHLKGRTELILTPATRRLLDGPRVAYYVTGEDRWAAADTWPPPGVRTALHLSADGALVAAGSPTAAAGVTGDTGPDRPDRDGPGPAGGSALVAASPAGVAAGARSYRSDPLDPFPTCGGASSGAALGPDGVQDRRAVEARPDVLLWTSTPLAEPLRIAGSPALVVHLDSAAPDVDVCATLVDVEPDGFAAGISEGAVRVRTVRNGWLAPGEVVELTVPLHDAAHTFRAGHRVRLEVAGANFPRLSRNLHSRVRPEHGTAADAVVAEQTVHHGAAHPSRLELPLTTS